MKAPKLFQTKAVAVRDDATVTPQTAELITMAGRVRELLEKAAAFFSGARQLERKAATLLEQAEKLKAPKTEAQDLAVQAFVKACVDARRENTEYWNDVTKGLHGLHKLAVAGRDRTDDPLGRAATIGNRIHYAYVDEAKRQADAKRERERIEAEERSRQDRERELEALEAAALKLERASDDLSEREQAFVADIVAGSTPVKAARRAAYRDPEGQAVRLIGMTKIIKAIAGAREAAAIRTQAVAVSQAPINPEITEVRTAVSKLAGTTSRTSRKAEIFDPEALKAAAMAGTHGVPADILKVDEVRANEYARELKEVINGWPGVRLVTDRGIS